MKRHVFMRVSRCTIIFGNYILLTGVDSDHETSHTPFIKSGD
uniref:Uncharacterized protein n=1 Tax=Arundo donax TaxID=35708 RepID=A0A0A9SM83_ARUDO